MSEDALVIPSDVQLVVQDLLEAADEEILNLFDACAKNDLQQVDELLRKPLHPDVTIHRFQHETTLQTMAKYSKSWKNSFAFGRTEWPSRSSQLAA